VLIISKKNGSIPLTLVVVSVALLLAGPAWTKTPVAADGGIGKLEKELQVLDKGSEKEISPRQAELATYEQRAEECIKAGKYPEAVENCSKAIAIDPEDLHAYRLRSVAYLHLKEPDKAKDDQAKLIDLQEQISAKNSKEEIAKYTEAIKADPKNAKAYANRAAAYMSLNQYEQAIEDSSKAIGLDATDKYAYFTRMAAYTALHENSKASADREKFQALDRGDKVRLSSSAVFDYSRMLDSNPKDSNALLNRARAYFELGQYANSKKDCDSLLRQNFHAAEVREIRSRCQKEIREHPTKQESAGK
jgi:tetratricopeptide (TPR) repeat protein